MTTDARGLAPAPIANVNGPDLYLRQVATVFQISVAKVLLSRQVLMVVGLAAIPIVFLLIMGIATNSLGEPVTRTMDNARRIYGFIYSTFILGAVILLGSAIIFTTLFRGEMLDRSIHYYLLAPVRREIVVLGKYLAGLLTAFVVFGTTAVVCYLLLYLPYGLPLLLADLGNGVTVGQLSNYLGITLLACMGYGSLFMAVGLLLRNPLVAVIIVAAWEFIHALLPPALKVISVIHYLKSLMPVAIDEGPLAIVVSPLSTWASVLGILLLTTAALLVSTFYLRRMEVRYTEE